MFKNTHVYSIYKKGKIREERVNRDDIVEIQEYKIERIDNPTEEFIESIRHKIWLKLFVIIQIIISDPPLRFN